MKRKSFSLIKYNPPLSKPYKTANYRPISYNSSTMISLTPLEESNQSLIVPLDKVQVQNDRFSRKMHDFFEFLKINENSKYEISNENLSENPIISNYSLWDFKKIRDFSKKNKRKYIDIALSPISISKQDHSLNLSRILATSSNKKAEVFLKKVHNSEEASQLKSNENMIFIEKTNEKSNKETYMKNEIANGFLEEVVKSQETLISQLKSELASYKSLLLSKNNDLTSLQAKSVENQQKLDNFDIVYKKNEVLMEYLKEKEMQLINSQANISNLKFELSSAESYRSLLHNQIQELKGNLRIFCRIKPIALDTFSVISITNPKDPHMLELKHPNNAKPTAFFFDKIFDSCYKQKAIFHEIEPFVQSCIDGDQVSILAYGQTGSGKTFTLEGEGLEESDENMIIENSGIMPRAIEFIFHEKKRLEILGRSLRFSMSIIEIYNENLADLLNPENKPILNQSGSKVMLKNLACLEITDMKQLGLLLKKASKARVTDKTHYNERSSRSHCIYRIIINYKEEKEKEGILNIVDLAGSERSSNQFIDELAVEKDKEKVKKIQNEANFINKSLTTLGRIVRLISEKQPLANIPYRESKLTRLLQDCLGGSGKTLMFINICANQDNYYQTKESLKFSAKAVL